MNEAFDIVQKLSGAGLATLLFLIIFGSYKGVWVWGYQLREVKAESEQWKAMAFQAGGLAELAGNIAKTQTRVP